MRALTLVALATLASCENRPPSPTASSQPAKPADAAPVAQPAPAPAPAPAPTPAPPPLSEPAAAVPAPPAGDVARLARNSNAFGFDLYARLRTQPGNIVVSPASITTALAMTWGGARGDTASQMQRVMHLEGTAAEVLNAAGALERTLEDPSRKIKFRIANRLFGEQTFAFEQPYLDQTRTAFGAPLEKLDFKTAAPAARAQINGWVESETEKRIVDLLPPDGVDKDTRLVLVNAIYFLGDWQEPFERDLTRDQPFHLAKARTKPVPTMNRTGSYRYVHDKGVAALELPYADGTMAMLIVVPDAVDGLAAVEKSFDAARLDAIVGSLKQERVWLQLPKFEIAPAQSLSLGKTLEAMGMQLAFDRRKADFTGIANPKDPADRLFIGKVFHKAFIKVDEKGTEAAAATAVSMPKAGAAPAKPLELVADRPFLYFVRDTTSGLVLFAGRVADPTTK